MPSVERSAWLLGLATSLAGEGTDDAAAAKELAVLAEGDVLALEGAYGRCLALVSVLPDDSNARRALDLLRRAIRVRG